MSAVFSFAFPALAVRVRAGDDLRGAYLRALSYVAAVYWPALALVILLAQPIVSLTLGPGWDAVVPLLRLLCVAALFWVPMIITTPTLFALGANRQAFLACLYGRSFGAAVMVAASFVSLTAMAASQSVSILFQAWISLRIARRNVGFEWRVLWVEAMRNVAVLVSSLTPPCLFVFLSESGLGMTPIEAALLGVLAVPGWVLGLWVARHPMREEIRVLFIHLRDHKSKTRSATPIGAGGRS